MYFLSAINPQHGRGAGGEAMAMLQAATTGHPGICTIHANDVFFLLRFGGFAAKTQQKRR
ncbi:hypothetical protein CJ255_14715 [Candidatus Viridilinea mediisalina]|uniref:Uncharacterized protein n=1 Tax=Candidatus Viridilinea mediisalina TaxID=2024553 RepID=A0A2A6RHB9_9CHLR|nr:hypothetical protein CJ255_14715 [Candidatus Viridilinea mediisalina]